MAVALIAGDVFCGGANATVSAGVAASQRWLSPTPDALTTRCNGACDALCVFRSGAQFQCGNATLANVLNTQCVHGLTCTYECVPTAAALDRPLRWSIEAADGAVLVRSATDTGENATVAKLSKPIARLDHLDLPGNVVELAVRGDSSFVVDADAVALASYKSLVHLELSNLNVGAAWTSLPSFTNLQYLSLANTSITQWPLNGTTPLSVETLDLQHNQGLQLKTGAFGTKLRSLNLASCGLKSLPTDFNTVVVSLRELTLDDNPLTTALASAAILPPVVNKLSLRKCDLSTLPAGLSDRDDLLTLDLSENPGIGNASFAALDSLPLSTLLSLNLGACALQSFPFESLASSPLKMLNLTGNPLLPSSIEAFTSSGSLTTIDLSSTGLTTIPVAVQQSATLETIHLAGNKLVSVAEWPAPASLRILDISASGLASLPQDTPPATLAALDVSLNALQSLPAHVVQSKSLRNLSISGNLDINLTTLPPQLEILNASNCSLTSLPMPTWSVLRVLDLSFNHLRTVEEVARVTKNLNFSDLSTDASRSFKRQLRLDLRSNGLQKFPAALLQLSKTISELDLRGNQFTTWLRLTTDQVAFLEGLDVVRLDQDYLDTSCSGSSKRTLSSGYTVCVDNNEATPGTVHPEKGGSKSTSGDDSSKQGSKSSSGPSQLTSTLITLGVFLVLLVLLVAVLTVLNKRAKEGSAELQEYLHHGEGRVNRTRFNLSSISVPTRDAHTTGHNSGIVVLPKIPTLEASSIDSDDSDAADLGLGDSAVATLNVEAASLLEDITDDLDFIAWRIRPRHVKLGSHIATGSSCFVYHAQLTVGGGPPKADGTRSPRKRLEVAVKKLPPHQTCEDVDAIERLAREIRVLAPFQHPKIVQFFGVSWTSRLDLQIVLEWMPDADLRTVLAHQLSAFGADSIADRWVLEDTVMAPRTSIYSTVAPGRSLRIALDVAEALVYVHSVDARLQRSRRHWRLTSHKVLFDSSRDVAKLSDFGSSAKDREAFQHLRRWIAPEVLASDSASPDGESSNALVLAGDVYAFGILLAELDTFKQPYHTVLRRKSTVEGGPDDLFLASERTLLRAVVRGDVDDMRPLLVSPSCPPAVADLVRWCTQREPRRRPTAAQLAKRLRWIAASVGGSRVSSVGIADARPSLAAPRASEAASRRSSRVDGEVEM